MWVLSVLYAIYWIGRRSSSIIQKNLPNMADKSDKDASDWLPNPKSRTDMQFHKILPSWIEAIKAFLTTEDTMQQAVEIGLVDE
ncbi:hypothetical protein SDJN02_20760, partial [Cucurbita argyrosperma subsp. argyrosperma]